MKEILFYKVNEPYGFFSNFSPHPIYIKGEVWKTVEHYFQANKFEEEPVRERIKLLESPMHAAIEGRNRSNSIKVNWEHIKDSIMEEALNCKFLQHPKLRKELLLSGEAKIIEHTVNDNYWADGVDGNGNNMLGILLMKIREEIRESCDDPDLILPPWGAFPLISQYDLFWRMGLGEDYLTNWYKYYSTTDMELYKQRFPAIGDWEDFYE